MASHIIQVERWNETGWAFLRVRDGDAPETNVIRCIDYNIFRDTPIPAEYRIRAGALTTLLFGFSERTVLQVEIRWFDVVGVWVADALVESARGHRLRRGEGDIPLAAVIELITDIQRY